MMNYFCFLNTKLLFKCVRVRVGTRVRVRVRVRVRGRGRDTGRAIRLGLGLGLGLVELMHLSKGHLAHVAVAAEAADG